MSFEVKTPFGAHRVFVLVHFFCLPFCFWNVKKWNERLFLEMYAAYRAGRATTDPSVNWVKGEIGFFDFYIIPLAKKLKECQVFGVSSDEYLNYALANRRKWEIEGQVIVEEMIERLAVEPSVASTRDGVNDGLKKERLPTMSKVAPASAGSTWSKRYYPANLRQTPGCDVALMEADEDDSA